jgi:hypothetical protein
MDEQIESKVKSRFAGAKKVLLYGASCGLAFIIIAFFMVCLSIRSGVKEISAMAVHEYPGERVEALIAFVESTDHSLRQRNRAVWALGQIGDKRALPVLKSFYTGGACEHDRALCQYELQKAIKLCEGSFNATAWLPR